MRPMGYRIINQPIYDQNGKRLWAPILAGAAIISAPFWLGLGRNNCCNYYPYYQQPYQPYQQPYQPYQQPYYQQPYYYQATPTLENNYYYY